MGKHLYNFDTILWRRRFQRRWFQRRWFQRRRFQSFLKTLLLNDGKAFIYFWHDPLTKTISKKTISKKTISKKTISKKTISKKTISKKTISKKTISKFFENASLKWRESIYIFLTRSFDEDDFKEDYSGLVWTSFDQFEDVWALTWNPF